MTNDEFGEIHEVWTELKTTFDEIDGLNDASRIMGIAVSGTNASQRASTR